MTSYLEGRLAPAERARIDVHLANCPVCTEYLAQMRQTLRLLGRLPEDTIPLDARNRLLSIFRDWKRESSSAP